MEIISSWEIYTMRIKYLIESDNDDNKFVDCAINSGAMFIVTEDHHFNVLKQIQFPHVDCIGIDAFIEVLCHQD